MWRSNADMYVTVPYNEVLFSILYFFTCPSEVDFGIAYVQTALRTPTISTSNITLPSSPRVTPYARLHNELNVLKQPYPHQEDGQELGQK